MVTGLQLPLKDVFPVEAGTKSASGESETLQGLTFGGILRAKEKQMQDAQTVSASSIAAAMTAWQALPATRFANEAIASQALTVTQDVESESSEQSQAEMQEMRSNQPEQASPPIPEGFSPAATPDAGQRPAEGMRIEAQSPSGKEVPTFQTALPDGQGTSGREAVKSKLAAPTSIPNETRRSLAPQPDVRFPQAAIKTSSYEMPVSESGSGSDDQATTGPAFKPQAGPVSRPARFLSSGQTIEPGQPVPHTRTSKVELVQDLPEIVSSQNAVHAENPAACMRQMSDKAAPSFDSLQPEVARLETEIHTSEKVTANIDKVRQGMQSIAFTKSPHPEHDQPERVAIPAPVKPGREFPAIKIEEIEVQSQIDALTNNALQAEAGSAQLPAEDSLIPRLARTAVPLQGINPGGIPAAEDHLSKSSVRQLLEQVINTQPVEPEPLYGRHQDVDVKEASVAVDMQPVERSWAATGKGTAPISITPEAPAAGGTQATASTIPSVPDPPEIKPGQAAVSAEKPAMAGQHITVQAAPPVEVWQSEAARLEAEAPASKTISNLSEKYALGDIPHEVSPKMGAVEDGGESIFRIKASINFDKVRQGMQPVAFAEIPRGAPAQPGQEPTSTPVKPGHEFPTMKPEVVAVQSQVDPPVNKIPQADVGAVQWTTKSSSISGFAQTVEPFQETVLGGGDAAGSVLHAVEASPKAGGQSMSSDTGVSKFSQVRANPQSKAEAVDTTATTVQFAGQEAAQPVVTSREPMKEARLAAAVSSSTDPADGKIKPAARRPEVRPGMEVAANQTPQASGNFVESVAGTGSTREAKFQTAKVIQQIVQHVETRVHNRSTEMHLQLNPKELGTIDVQMVSGPQGVTVTFSAEQPATGRLLESQLGQLHQSLAEAGVKIAGLNIGQHGQPRQEGGFLNQTPQFTHPPRHDDAPKGANVQETRRSARGIGRAGEVDYLI
jgi:flagellar hook-length control protein FliK